MNADSFNVAGKKAVLASVELCLGDSGWHTSTWFRGPGGYSNTGPTEETWQEALNCARANFSRPHDDIWSPWHGGRDVWAPRWWVWYLFARARVLKWLGIYRDTRMSTYLQKPGATINGKGRDYWNPDGYTVRSDALTNWAKMFRAESHTKDRERLEHYFDVRPSWYELSKRWHERAKTISRAEAWEEQDLLRRFLTMPLKKSYLREIFS